jgi:hypothetical protein
MTCIRQFSYCSRLLIHDQTPTLFKLCSFLNVVDSAFTDNINCTIKLQSNSTIIQQRYGAVAAF